MRERALHAAGVLVLASLLVGCATAGTRTPAQRSMAARPAAAPVPVRPAPRPPAPADASADSAVRSAAAMTVPDAEPVPTPVRADGANRPYQIGGRSYVPQTEDLPVVERGLASWYGSRFHGRRTASGEIYDMRAMTAAHPTMPLPSYARVRNPANGREVVVRINDRGPFHPGRIIDLSQVAATRLGISGIGRVEVRRFTNDEIRTGAWRGLPLDPSAGDDPRLALRRGESAMAAAEAAAEAPPPVLLASATELPAPPITSAAAAPSAGLSPEQLLSLAPPAAASAPAPDGPAALAAWWVQLGAFRVRDGAESFRHRIVQDVQWLAPVLIVQSDAELHRLQAGPFASRDQAHDVAERLKDALSLVPLVVERP